MTQAWVGGPLSARTAELALLEGRPPMPDCRGRRAEAPWLQPHLAASLYTLGLRAAADRAELARARRTEEEELEARRGGPRAGRPAARPGLARESRFGRRPPHARRRR